MTKVILRWVGGHGHGRGTVVSRWFPRWFEEAMVMVAVPWFKRGFEVGLKSIVVDTRGFMWLEWFGYV